MLRLTTRPEVGVRDGDGETGPGEVREHVRTRPVHAVRHLVAGYSGYREAGVPPALHRGLPSPYLTLIFTLDDPLQIAAHPDPRAAPGRYDALVGGLHTTPAVITHDGRQSGVQVAVSPLACRALFGVPAGELAGLDLHADQVLGPVAGEARERLLLAPDWPCRFAVLDDLLLRLASRSVGRGAHREVARAWQLLLHSRGAMPVRRLAAEVGWSERHLAGRFGAEIGLAPKAAARVVRFDRARREVERRVRATGTAPRLAGIAAESGYYDQAHLAREFARLAGSAPSSWLAEEFRFLQATSGPPDTG